MVPPPHVLHYSYQKLVNVGRGYIAYPEEIVGPEGRGGKDIPDGGTKENFLLLNILATHTNLMIAWPWRGASGSPVTHYGGAEGTSCNG